MEVNYRISGDEGEILVACLVGEVDHHSGAALRQSIDSSLRAFTCKYLVLDFRGVGFMDSSGIGVVLGRYKRVKELGGAICLSGCNRHIERILEMSGVFSLITVKESCLDAEDYIREIIRDEVVSL